MDVPYKNHKQEINDLTLQCFAFFRQVIFVIIIEIDELRHRDLALHDIYL